MMRFDAVSAFLSRNDNIIITAHETPDGDAIGSECSTYLALKSLGKEVLVINADPMAYKYQFMDTDHAVKTLSEPDVLPKDLSVWALMILDTNDINNIGQVRDVVIPYVREYYIVDHHDSGEDISDQMIVEEDASSTCEILFQLFKELHINLTLEIAQALYTGIVYDTGSFIYPKTTARTFAIAYELVSAGVSPNFVYSKIYESNSVPALKLQSKVMSTLELYYDSHVAVQTMLKEMIAECHALYEEADTIINIPLKSESIKESVFLKENEEGILRCSMRSKGDINVAAIAQFFGGGGHKTAAGFKSKFALETIKQKVLEMLKEYFE
jgi:phosphoesterase RecJ-like protein